MRRTLHSRLVAIATATLVASAFAVTPAGAADDADLQGLLERQLTAVGKRTPVPVMVHGTTVAAATDAVEAAGMRLVTTFDKIGVAVATGTRDQIDAVRSEPGVTYVEGNQPIETSQETSNLATRGAEAHTTLTGADSLPLGGAGVSVAVIDTGVDPNHPYLTNADKSSAVVGNYKVVCKLLIGEDCKVVKAPARLDTDLLALGGHGTHVSGIVAGRPTKLTDGDRLQGAAPKANIVSLSAGLALFVVGADAALNWVLENHEHPCGPDVPAAQCPPIKVINNSYGPSSLSEFDPDAAMVKLQRALAAEGVMTVWSNGNGGGDGSENLSSPTGQDQTPGIVSVASYFDNGQGTRDGQVSEFSSRGLAGDLSTYPDISAPGEDITSSCRLYHVVCLTGLDARHGPRLLDLGTFNTLSGTSMAAPHISGIIAQLFQADPTATPAEVERALKLTAHPYAHGAPYEPDPNGGQTSYDKGHGLVDVVAAYEYLMSH